MMQVVSTVISDMNLLLRNTLSENAHKKLWENTYIKKQIDKRKIGCKFSINDHICAMVYSFLSSGGTWDRLLNFTDSQTGRITPIDDVFHQYDPEYILKCSPQDLYSEICKIAGGTQYLQKQMEALICKNILKLQSFEKDHGSIDTYYGTYASVKELILALSSDKSKSKLLQMGIPLVCEYLRNVGYDIPKPDRHIRRILGSNYLGYSENEIVPEWEVFDIISSLAVKTGKSPAEIDYILWSYCAKGYGEICTKERPKCSLCSVEKFCTNKNTNLEK